MALYVRTGGPDFLQMYRVQVCVMTHHSVKYIYIYAIFHF